MFEERGMKKVVGEVWVKRGEKGEWLEIGVKKENGEMVKLIGKVVKKWWSEKEEMGGLV